MALAYAITETPGYRQLRGAIEHAMDSALVLYSEDLEKLI